MRRRTIITICLGIALLLIASFLNKKYEVIAIHPLGSDGEHDLKVMTWNVHCSKGADILRQKEIAEQVLKVDADLVLLNEYNQDSCSVTDSLLRTRYLFTEETLSHNDCGDIIYSKRALSNTGRLYEKVRTKVIQPIKATTSIGGDFVLIVGMHLTSNHYDKDPFGEGSRKGSSFFIQYKNAQEWRCFQAHKTKGEIINSKYPVIIMGDMNDFNCSAPLDTLKGCGLKDAWWDGGNGYGCTYHDGWLKLRIDHILYSKHLKLESIKVIDTNLSDHNPVVAGFCLKKN